MTQVSQLPFAPVLEGEDRKIRVLTLSDHPMSKSGIGIQAHQLITSLLDTGRYTFFSIGGAQKHAVIQPQMVQPYNQDWIIQPVEGFGDPQLMRQWLMAYRPDAILIFTDPRFFIWTFQMEEEIRDICPILFWTVWDNEPTPAYNKHLYSSCDDIAWFSRFSYEFHKDLETDAEFHCVPLARNTDIFKPASEADRKSFKIQLLTWAKRKAFTAFFVSRNARRKRPADVLLAWKYFLDGLPPEVLEDAETCPLLLMHTDPMDQEGPNLLQVLEMLDLSKYVSISPGKCSDEDMAKLYSMVDVTLNLSLNEGFGMSVHESLLCGTPCITTKTGGMTEQMTDGEQVFGELLEPDVKSLVGSQLVPYIYEDIVDPKKFAEAIRRMYDKTEEERTEMGLAGREHLLTNNSIDNILTSWDTILTNRVEEYKNPERIRAKLVRLKG